jgi:hypothetical protein
MTSVHDTDAPGDLARFRQEFYDCLTTRCDALFELTGAVLSTDGPVTSLPELSLATVHSSGHGALYDSISEGRTDIGRFRNIIARQQILRCDDDRIVLAIDVSNWLRPDANTSPDRSFCHTYARRKGHVEMIPAGPTRSWSPSNRPHILDCDPRRPTTASPTAATPTAPAPNSARSSTR